jgi:hypothetical protein
MEYRLRSSGEVISEVQMRSLFSDVDFSSPVNLEIADKNGIDPVYPFDAPDPSDGMTYVRNGVVQKPDGRWYYDWTQVTIAGSTVTLATLNIHKASLIKQIDVDVDAIYGL